MQPENFSFIDSFIAGSAIPYSREHVDHYASEGITHVVSLTVDVPDGIREYLLRENNPKITSVHIPVYSVPTERAMQSFYNTIKDAQEQRGKVLVHCQFGQERTGIMLAYYLIEFKGMKNKDALEFVREYRPGSLTTYNASKYVSEI